MSGGLDRLAAAIAGCRLCIEQPKGAPLPHAPRPVARLSATAKLAVCGQAPGTRVHATGLPFNDPSGDRLRAWMGIGRDTFYDDARIAIVPMGLCFPGQDARGADLPPRPECAAHWHDRIFAAMPRIELVLAVGQYAQRYHLGPSRRSVSETVADWRALVARPVRPAVWPLPHPSWRNTGWLKCHPWFEAEVLPALRAEVSRLVP